MNDNFINMVKEFNISKSIVQFINRYTRMKKSSLSLHFLKNNFKIIKEICHENAIEFKQIQYFLTNIFIL